MNIVFQNPQLTCDSMKSGTHFPGLHDYAVDFLRLYRPAVRIWPIKRLWRWFQFLQKKHLPLTGWRYVFSESHLAKHDVWLSLTGDAALPLSPPPRKFSGMKIHHVMDYSHRASEAAALLRAGKVDYLLGYSSHDKWCSFFQKMFSNYTDRVVPVPFGYSSRFRSTTPFSQRVPKCAAMGAVNPVCDPQSVASEITEYTAHFSNEPWAHAMRAAIRSSLVEKPDELTGIVANFMALPPAMRNVSYDSVAELNRHQLFLNDESIMRYPPARTYEGSACGTVMVCSDHPVYSDFGWKGGVNCVTHRYPEIASFTNALRSAIADPERLSFIQRASLENAARFSHAAVAEGLYAQIQLLWKGRVDEARNYWTR
jgi:hypothetical protein